MENHEVVLSTAGVSVQVECVTCSVRVTRKAEFGDKEWLEALAAFIEKHPSLKANEGGYHRAEEG